MPAHGIRAVYQPFSLQERMAPLNMMKEEYDKVNEGLADLEMNTNQVAQYIDPSSQAGQTLAAYNKMLEDTAGILSREGLKGVSRTALYNLRRAYQSQVAPINEGAKNYAALQAQIKQMQWKDPTIMVNDMPTLDEYIKNPNALPNLVSGAQLQQEGATAALQLQGVDYDTISRYLKGDTSAIPNLNQTVQRIAQSYGVSSQQALDYISRGVLAGLGERATKLDMARQEADMKFDYQMRLEKYQQGQQNYRAGLSAAAQKRDDDLRALMSGYVWNSDTKQYEFSQEAFDNAAKSYSGTHSQSRRGSSSSSSGGSTQKYNPANGVAVFDADGSIVGTWDNGKQFNDSKVEDEIKGKKGTRKTVSITSLPNDNIKKAVVDRAGVDYDDDYFKNANGTINWDRVIDEYRDILNMYEYSTYTDKRGNIHVRMEKRGSATQVGGSDNSRTSQIDEKYGTGGGEDGSNYVPNQ